MKSITKKMESVFIIVIILTLGSIVNVESVTCYNCTSVASNTSCGYPFNTAGVPTCTGPTCILGESVLYGMIYDIACTCTPRRKYLLF